MDVRKINLRNFQSPGDLVMLTAAVRDLHLSNAGAFATAVQSPCPVIWENNPHVAQFLEGEVGVEQIDCEYPLIHESNHGPWHFIHGFSQHLSKRLGVSVRPTAFKGDIHLSLLEKSWLSQVQEVAGQDIPFWIIVAGGKYDFTAKWWDPERFQKVVDFFSGRILFVQVGEAGHYHPPLHGVLDLRGKTDLRQLIRLVYHSQGVLCPVTLAMHLAAAVETKPGMPRNRPCVVVAGGREPAQWEAYPHHQYIHTNGALTCCEQGGCWKARTVPLGDRDEKDLPQHLCVNPVALTGRERVASDRFVQTHIPRCMDMISADEVIGRISLYFEGGAVRYLTPSEAEAARRIIRLPVPDPRGSQSAITAPAIKTDAAEHASKPNDRNTEMIAVTIGIGDKWAKLAGLAAESVRRRTGLETRILGEEAEARQPVKAPHYLKLHLFELFPSVENILYFDADMIFLQEWDPRALSNRFELVCVRDRAELGCVKEDAAFAGIDPKVYFNSGLMILNRTHHAPLLARAAQEAGPVESPLKDQPLLNRARVALGIPAMFLPKEYNFLGFGQLPEMGAVVVGHFHLIDERKDEEIEPYFRSWLEKGFGKRAPGLEGRIVISQPDGPPAPSAAHREVEHRRLLSEAAARDLPYPAERFAGRGIVICGGGVKFFPSVWVSLKMLRRLGCRLPVEVWHLGPGEMTDQMRGLLAPLGAAAVDALAVRESHPVRTLRGWELKPYSIIHSKFEEVLLLDADNLPVADPTALFDEEEYRKQGAIFWPDYERLGPDREIWRLTGVAYRDEPEFESGQIVVNKRKCWNALHLAMHFNEYSDYYYDHIHGDKDTFRFAWRMLGLDYAMPARGIERLEATMCQHDLRGGRLFQHRNFDKWRMDGRNRRIAGFLFEEECRAFLRELDVLWWKLAPEVTRFTQSGRSQSQLDAARFLCNTRYEYHRVGFDRRPMTFSENGCVGVGAADNERFWDLYEENGGIELWIFSEHRPMMKLSSEPEGRWKGAWLDYERMPIQLTPAGADGHPCIPQFQVR